MQERVREEVDESRRSLTNDSVLGVHCHFVRERPLPSSSRALGPPSLNFLYHLALWKDCLFNPVILQASVIVCPS